MSPCLWTPSLTSPELQAFDGGRRRRTCRIPRRRPVVIRRTWASVPGFSLVSPHRVRCPRGGHPRRSHRRVCARIHQSRRNPARGVPRARAPAGLDPARRRPGGDGLLLARARPWLGTCVQALLGPRRCSWGSTASRRLVCSVGASCARSERMLAPLLALLRRTGARPAAIPRLCCPLVPHFRRCVPAFCCVQETNSRPRLLPTGRCPGEKRLPPRARSGRAC